MRYLQVIPNQKGALSCGLIEVAHQRGLGVALRRQGDERGEGHEENRRGSAGHRTCTRQRRPRRMAERAVAGTRQRIRPGRAARSWAAGGSPAGNRRPNGPVRPAPSCAAAWSRRGAAAWRGLGLPLVFISLRLVPPSGSGPGAVRAQSRWLVAAAGLRRGRIGPPPAVVAAREAVS